MAYDDIGIITWQSQKKEVEMERGTGQVKTTYQQYAALQPKIYGEVDH